MNGLESSLIIRFGRRLGASIFLLSAPIGGYFLLQIYLTARASETWPAAAGKVIKADVGRTSVGRYYPEILYSYVVGDREYRGTRVRASDGESDSRDTALRAIRGLTPGQRVEVRYDPTEPSRSLLQPGAGFQEHALLLVPILTFAIGMRGIPRLRWSQR